MAGDSSACLHGSSWGAGAGLLEGVRHGGEGGVFGGFVVGYDGVADGYFFLWVLGRRVGDPCGLVVEDVVPED